MVEDIFFTVTVDTEADDAWKVQDRIGLRNISAIPRFQALCEAYAVVPTYLLTYECAVRDEALKVLKPISDRGGCEIGYHFHSWTTPPFEAPSPQGVDLKWRYAYQYELPDSLFKEKAECLLTAIEKAFGMRPTAHRAGRWGIDQRSVDWLIEHAFEVDTTVVPLWNLSKARGRSMGGPSFFSAPKGLFFWPHGSQAANPPKSLLEVPLSVYTPTGVLPAFLAACLGKLFIGKKPVASVYRKLIGGDSLLRPNPAYADGFVEKIINSNLNRRPTIINLMIHSSELMLGLSPFSRTEADCARLWQQLRQAFALIRHYNIRSLGISASAMRLKGLVGIYESPDFTPRLARYRRSGELLQEAGRQILDTGRAAHYRNTPG